MRLFIAINLNEPWMDWLMNAAGILKQSSDQGRFTLRENLHLTLVFLGETEEDRLGLVKSAMNRVNSKSFSLEIAELGRFRRHGGDLYWAGVKENETLMKLQDKLSKELLLEGFSLEKRAFSPHLTLGRQVKLRDDFQKLKALAEGEVPPMEVRRFSLMKSERINGRMVYTELYGRDLTE